MPLALLRPLVALACLATAIAQAAGFDTLEIPALTVELERAIWQVENKLKKEEEQAQEAARSRVEEVKDDEKKDQ